MIFDLFCFFSTISYSNSILFTHISMKPYYLFATLAIFSITGTAFSASVSGEISTKAPVKKPVAVVTTVKKPVQKAITRKYVQKVSYMSPAGKEFITFSITTKNGVIASVLAIPKSKNAISLSLQKAFSKNLAKAVVGKKVKNFTIDAIGWASLTTDAFEKFMKKAI